MSKDNNNPPNTDDQPTDSGGELTDWKTEAEKNLHGWKRASADYQNLKRESEERQKQLKFFLGASFLSDLLPLIDHLRQAYSHIPAASRSESWAVGLCNVIKQFEEMVKSQGVEQITAVGEMFDPSRHESLGTESDPTKPDHAILKELQPGYTLSGQVIYPSKVIINNLDGEQPKPALPDK